MPPPKCGYQASARHPHPNNGRPAAPHRRLSFFFLFALLWFFFDLSRTKYDNVPIVLIAIPEFSPRMGGVFSATQ